MADAPTARPAIAAPKRPKPAPKHKRQTKKHEPHTIAKHGLRA